MNEVTKVSLYKALLGAALLAAGIIFSVVISENNSHILVVFRGLIVVGGILLFYGLYQIIENNTLIVDNTKYNEEEYSESDSPTVSIDDSVKVLVEYIEMVSSDQGNALIDWKSAAKVLLIRGFSQENLSKIMLDAVYAQEIEDPKKMGAYNQIANYINISPYLTKQNISAYEQNKYLSS